jgi:ABC-2 type transport system permease protein
MRALADIYWVQFKTLLAVQLQYRVSLLIWLIGMIMEPLMNLVVWTTVSQMQGGGVESYSTGDFAGYFIASMLVNHITFTWIMWEYEYLIKDGTLSGFLLRPIHPIHRDLTDNVVYKAITLTILIPVAIILGLAFHPTLPTNPWAIAAFIPALLLSAALRFLTEWTLALSAFWMTRVSALNQLYFVTMLFFSGRLAPLELFPQFVRDLSFALPFRWMIYFPVELLFGRLTLSETLTGFALQIAWLALVLLVLRFVWNAGVKRFSAVGA